MREYSEPRLSAEDVRLWDIWMLAAGAHATTRLHRARVDTARARVALALDVAPDMAVMWSGGKDSTALTHLACVDMRAPLRVYSEKDDLDYPGEEEYVSALAAQWGLDLEIVRPDTSPRAWIAAHANQLYPITTCTRERPD